MSRHDATSASTTLILGVVDEVTSPFDLFGVVDEVTSPFDLFGVVDEVTSPFELVDDRDS